MLRKLSVRNIKRQFKDYALYFITLACTVSFLYAFHALIFSESVKAFPSIGVLPYMIVASSLLIVFIMGWIVGYMTNYILKRRSKELSIYMLLGIPNRSISRLVFYENSFIGAFAFLLGLPIGVFLSQVLDAILSHMFGVEYTLNFHFSLNAAGFTFSYFLIIFFYAIWKNSRWVQKIRLYELLMFERKNEKSLLSGRLSAASAFLFSVIAGCGGIVFLVFQPLGNGYDVLIGILGLVVFLVGFFISVPVFLITQFGEQAAWKYGKNRLVVFREFTAKIGSISMVMGILSVLFMLSLTFMGVGTAVYKIANKNIEQSVFDIMILHPAEWKDFSAYETVIYENFPVQSSYTYSIYTDAKTDFVTIRNDTILSAGRSDYPSIAEFQYDTYIKQSDYQKLREMLGYDLTELDPSLCYVHCISALEKEVAAWIGQEKSLNCGGYLFAPGGVFCEPFSQMDTYGNGWDFCVIVPDQAVSQMEVLYSLLAVRTDTPLNSYDLKDIMENCEGLAELQRNVGKTAPDGKGVTALIKDADYLSGKWVEKGSLAHLYAMAICLFYLALILEITGAAILATQILSDKDKKYRKDRILWQLGMTEKVINRLNNCQLLQLFLLPLLPAWIISSCFVYISAGKMQFAAFHLPVFADNFWIAESLGMAFVFFGLLYSIYYIAAKKNLSTSDT